MSSNDAEVPHQEHDGNNPESGTRTDEHQQEVVRDERSKKEKNLENWLPITASREAKWWYSAFHNVTAMVGAGVLGLPFAMSQLGWSSGLIAIAASWVITLYSLWQLVELHELVPGTRFDRYPELGKHVFGQRSGYWIVMPQQLTVQIATDIVYMVTGGKSLKKSIYLLFPHLASVRQTYFIMFFAVIQLGLSQIPNFNSLKSVSLLAAVMSFCYSAIACITSIMRGMQPHHIQPSYALRSTKTWDIVFDVFNAVGTVAFAFAGHSVVLEIQATVPSTEEKPSKKPMWKGVVVAYIIVAICYFAVAISGFWAFGNTVEDDVLVSLEHPHWLVAIANFMVFLHVLGSYQVFAMPVFDFIESNLVKKANFTPGTRIRVIARSLYVLLTAFIGIMIPFFGGLLGFFGGLVFAPTSYFIPCIMWLRVHKPKMGNMHWIACWISIVVGVIVMILSPFGGLVNIIRSFRTYELFS